LVLAPVLTCHLKPVSVYDACRDEGTLYSFLYPAQNPDLVEALAKKKLTAFGMDCVPRISRAQVNPTSTLFSHCNRITQIFSTKSL
jgi:NAD/NADP transhydrogenase alpha subunit